MTITISNPIKSSVGYADSLILSPDLVLGNTSQQTITFDSGSYKFITFNIVDSSYVTIGDIFDQVIANSPETITKILVINEAAKQYEKTASGWGADFTDPINYDKAYFVNIITTNNVQSTLTINGKQVRGINMGFTIGWNFMGIPTVYESVDVSGIVHNTIANSTDTFWSKLNIMFNKSGGFILGGASNGNPTYTLGSMIFNPGDGYITSVLEGLILLIGSLLAQRNKGDFNGDNNITNADAIALANYIVTINPDYASIASAITSEGSSNYWANIKSTGGTTVGLNDLVYLISHIASPGTYSLS
jgi:hypothetical protein